MIGWIITGIVLTGLGIGGYVGWRKLKAEHKEARSLPLDRADFSQLKDGSFHGSYAGGMYKWRVNECQVSVQGGRVSGIDLLVSQDPGNQNTDAHTLYQRVIDAQSLQVDTISGATLTSKAYLAAVQDALLQAQA